VVVLRFWEDPTQEQIADVLDVPIGAVKSTPTPTHLAPAGCCPLSAVGDAPVGTRSGPVRVSIFRNRCLRRLQRFLVRGDGFGRRAAMR